MNSTEEQIQIAIQEGKFSNLAGEGKPLQLEEDGLVDPDWRLAYHLLRANGYSLPWIEERREIDAEIDGALEALESVWEYRHSKHERFSGKENSSKAKPRAQPGEIGQSNQSTDADEEWLQAERAFTSAVKRINQRIFNYNLQIPADRFQLFQLNAEKEIDRIRRGDRRQSV